MTEACLEALAETLPAHRVTDEAIECHHNYASRERHAGADVFVTRKGAISARTGELGIVAGSMGAHSYIVRGRGNAESFHSCAHGAGRLMSRGAAKRQSGNSPQRISKSRPPGLSPARTGLVILLYKLLSRTGAGGSEKGSRRAMPVR